MFLPIDGYKNILIQAEREVLENNKPKYTISPVKVQDAVEFIKIGFFPSKDVYFAYYNEFQLFGFLDKNSVSTLFYNEYVMELLNNTDEDTLQFWYGCVVTRHIKECHTWEYRTIKTIKEKALSQGGNLQLILYAPELVYTSKRPITDMSMFQTATSIIYDKVKDMEGIQECIGKIIPVTRYAPSLKEGIYYDKNNHETYIGTFYYNEAESKTFLSYETSMTFKNKYEAYEHLKEHCSVENTEQRLIDYFLKSQEVGCKILRGEIQVKEDLMYTPLEMVKFLKDNHLDPSKDLYENEYNIFEDMADLFPENVIEETVYRDYFVDMTDEELRFEFMGMTDEEIQDKLTYVQKKLVFYHNMDILASRIPPVARFCGKWLGMYAIEDCFDQTLCQIGRKLQVDIMIFEQSVGSHGFISEILDCRERHVSFNSLIFT